MINSDFVRVTAANHATQVADPLANANAAIEFLKTHKDSDVVVFGELSLTGYSCGDLFAQDALLAASQQALAHLADAAQSEQLVVVGTPILVAGKLFNAAAVIQSGRVCGVVPKQFLPNYQEFYEARWFVAADGSEPTVCRLGPLTSQEQNNVPFGIDLLFRCGGLCIGIELCEDLWMPIPPSSRQALAGANLLLNLSASNELIGKARWREELVKSQSGRCLAAYAYASAGPTESTTDVVFGGHCIIAENGSILNQARCVGSIRSNLPTKANSIQADYHQFAPVSVTADIDLQRLRHDRSITTSWQTAARRESTQFRIIDLPGTTTTDGRQRFISGRPFVPQENSELEDRCREIFEIQCAALAKRVSRLPERTSLQIGVSGGLDSTLALLVAVKTCRTMGWQPKRIAGITMPGFGTTTRTLTSARRLMQQLEISQSEIDIRQLCLDTFLALGHQPFSIKLDGLDLEQFEAKLAELAPSELHDLTFENVQARQRTMILMSRGFVLGTGDLSEQALGWSTYNGDHMSMYNVNASIPKTLVRFLVKHIALQEFDGAARQTLLDVVDTPISPELLPHAADDSIVQLTEDSVGAYELHDFFLYNMIRFGASPNRILQLAELAEFSRLYEAAEIRATLRLFLTRFFNNQFKRSCVPDGPKVGSVSLSPRGDWRMPSDAEVTAWLRELED